MQPLINWFAENDWRWSNFFLPGLEMDSKFLFFGGLVILLPLISRRLKYNHETDVKPSYNPTEL